jgi:hypothetical protein
MKNLFLWLSLFSMSIANAQQKKIIYYPNGNKHYEYEMKNDLLNGSFTCYYENGVIMLQGNLVNNERISEWKGWDQAGILREVRNYTNNEQFQIIDEWDKNNNKLSADIIAQKNAQVLEAADISWNTGGHALYNRRLWETIKKENPVNDFLFTNNYFFKELVDGARNNKFSVFTDDRFVHQMDNSAVNGPENVKVIEYLIKEDLFYYREQKTIRKKIIGICPVIQEDHNRRELGWFFWPDVLKGLSDTKELQPILFNLFSQAYSGVIFRDSFGAPGSKWREVKPDESLLIKLTILQYEASAWIYQIDKGF